MSIWFTSDLHFNNENIIKYNNRPFNSVEEMNEKLIENWNSIVSQEDIVYVLGDFIMGSPKDVKPILDKLKGKIILIVGNHDTNAKLDIYSELNIEIHEVLKLKIGKIIYILFHYPIFIRSWEGQTKNRIYALSGHTHSENKFYENIPWNYNVGVDANNYKPVNIEDIKQAFKEKEENLNKKVEELKC